MTESDEKEDSASLESERSNLHLAHWPPPMRAKDNDSSSSHSKRKVKERPQLAHRRGTRLTRSLFTDLSDDD